jgi:uncharacterized protein
MMFWDSSALVPTMVAETSSSQMRALAHEDFEVYVWWATQVECVSAIARRERTNPSDVENATEALATLTTLAESWIEVPPSESLRETARRLLRVHDLRAGDAFQLAAARIASDHRPESLPLVTLDERLALAARREGFPVLP